MILIENIIINLNMSKFSIVIFIFFQAQKLSKNKLIQILI